METIGFWIIKDWFLEKVIFIGGMLNDSCELSYEKQMSYNEMWEFCKPKCLIIPHLTWHYSSTQMGMIES
jgi:hypothetical protein